MKDDVVTQGWTVYVEAGVEATASEVERIGGFLATEVPGVVMAPAPSVGCWFVLDAEPLPTRALAAAQTLLVVAVRTVMRVSDPEVPLVRAELTSGGLPGQSVRQLATAKGLAPIVGRSPSWVRTLMKYKGAPDPVPVEGGTESVYAMDEALAYLERVTAGE